MRENTFLVKMDSITSKGPKKDWNIGGAAEVLVAFLSFPKRDCKYDENGGIDWRSKLI